MKGEMASVRMQPTLKDVLSNCSGSGGRSFCSGAHRRADFLRQTKGIVLPGRRGKALRITRQGKPLGWKRIFWRLKFGFDATNLLSRI